MSIEDQDQRLTDLIAEALIPRGFRPQSDNEIEALLDAMDSEPLNEEEIKHILAKARGKVPIGERKVASIEQIEYAFSESEKELVALYRSQGKELPPEIQKKLEELRRKAKEEEKTKEKENGQQK
jgi:hypothetical protein